LDNPEHISRLLAPWLQLDNDAKVGEIVTYCRACPTQSFCGVG